MNTDEKLWKIAKKRADFKRHLVSYVLVCLFLWGIWWFTAGRYDASRNGVPWPAWVMLGWGLGLGFKYFDAYGEMDKDSATEREYQKLKDEKNNS